MKMLLQVLASLSVAFLLDHYPHAVQASEPAAQKKKSQGFSSMGNEDTVKRGSIRPVWIKSLEAEVFARSDSTAAPIDTLKQGDKLYVHEVRGTWVRVRWYDFLASMNNMAAELLNKDERSKEHKTDSPTTFEGWIKNDAISNTEVKFDDYWKWRREVFFSRNPQLDSGFRDGILHRKPMLGMSREMVTLSGCHEESATERRLCFDHTRRYYVHY